ncbi:unnamed protein product [Rangifer tarandus platyrhynchus]|uniref:Uncharacterized protein n=2 Tax=Rangifer tarandus platyrhynchus TaxID=3082113 RepID=A0ACB0F4J4_RANTA|nr:unnamed protein product [Rangifer tarandus platyrhynchus]CAI9707880.1 unnamed protein product [Rangifer tarandus platyrhynchus]
MCPRVLGIPGLRAAGSHAPRTAEPRGGRSGGRGPAWPAEARVSRRRVGPRGRGRSLRGNCGCDSRRPVSGLPDGITSNARSASPGTTG